MKTIQKLFDGIAEVLQDVEVSSVHIDSRDVVPGGMFFALRGSVSDGHDFIASAIEHGAVAIVCEEIKETVPGIVYVVVPSVKDVAGIVVSRFFDNPSQQMTIIGVTGTNGKTSVATMGYQALTALGFCTGLLSTVVNKIGTEEFESTHTTGDVVQIHKNLKAMVEAACTHCCMEVSSHALDQGRVVGVDFDVAIFTNLTQDHLDYHHTMDAYAQAKKIFFDMLKPTGYAIINHDDPYALYMTEDCPGQVKYYGTHVEEEYTFSVEENSLQSLQVSTGKFGTLNFPTLGLFNAYNGMAVLATLDSLSLIHQTNITPCISAMTGAPGRMEVVWNDGVLGIVDYAHTPDALEKVLSTLSQLRTVHGDIVVVFGAGGDRDTTKRPRMAMEVAKYSSKAIVTDDNPRTENPEIIAQEIVAGFPQAYSYDITPNRKEAIEKAVSFARAGDIILVAGKGHETYQIIGTTKFDFDDRQELRNALQNKFIGNEK